MKMKSVYCYMLAGLMLSASSCSSWLSEDDAPVMSYDYYETEAGVNAAITAAYVYKIPVEYMKKGLAEVQVSGRMEEYGPN